MNAPLKDQVHSDLHIAEAGYADTRLVEVDLLGFFRALRRHLNVIVGITLGLTALIMVAVLQLTPRYTAEALVLLDAQRTQVVDVEAVMSGLSADSATVDSQVEVVASRSIARRIVEKLNLIEDPEFNAELAKPSVFAWLDPRGWIKSLFGSDAELTAERKRELTMDAVVDGFIGREGIDRRALTYIIEVKFTSEDPAKAATIANAIADTYVLDQLEAKFNATKQANEWLSQRLEGLKRQVADSERAVEIYRAQNGLQSARGTTINEQQLSELNAQLILARADRAEKQAKYARAKQILSSGGSIESVVDVLQSQTISDLRQQQAELASKQADLSTKYGPRHPAIINMDAQRRDIQSQIGAEIRRIVDSIANEAAISDTRVKALEGSLDELQTTSSKNSQAEVRLRELEREASANKAVYESFLGRFKETSQQQDLQMADSRIISEAVAPAAPSFPRKGLIGSIALTFSLLVGFATALLLERLDNGLQTSTQIEEILNLPHLGSVPAIPVETGSDRKPILPHDYLLQKPLSAFSESLRSLRSALSLSNVDNPPKIILFTSALPNEGKTTTAISFARAAAHAGQKVLLVDCDLRHPSVHRVLGAGKPKEGLVEYLAGRVSFADVMVKDAATGLDFIPVASGAANPPDLLGSAQMRRILREARDAYDLVILDTAPVLPVSDSRVLAQLSDKTVFVVRWDETPRDAAIGAAKELRTYKADIAGAILTMVDTAKQAKYGYGDGGYYYRRYSRYYSN